MTPGGGGDRQCRRPAVAVSLTFSNYKYVFSGDGTSYDFCYNIATAVAC